MAVTAGASLTAGAAWTGALAARLGFVGAGPQADKDARARIAEIAAPVGKIPAHPPKSLKSALCTSARNRRIVSVPGGAIEGIRCLPKHGKAMRQGIGFTHPTASRMRRIYPGFN
jgi:hypothetical protein